MIWRRLRMGEEAVVVYFIYLERPQQKSLASVSGNTVEFQTGNLPNTTPECYPYSNLLDSVVSYVRCIQEEPQLVSRQIDCLG